MCSITTIPICIICNGSCTSSRSSLHIFNKENQLCTKKSLPVLMSQILEKEITEESVHSSIICKKCFKLFDHYEELIQQVQELKRNLVSNYKSSLEKYNNGEVNQNLVDEKYGKDNDKIFPKKILDIPSSDDDSFQVVNEKPQFDDEVEVGLRKNDNKIEEAEHALGQKDNSSGSENEQLKSVQIKLETGLCDISEKPNILRKRNITRKVKEEEENVKQEIISANKISSHEGTSYTCLLCPSENSVFYDAKNIMQHVKTLHDIRIYICDVCGADFRKRNELSSHLDDHVATEEGDFQCEVCNRIFCNLRLFRIHKRMHYPQNKAWGCETCGKKYSSKNLLEEHINTHTGVRPYICGTCGKDFASKYTFRAHEKTHSVRPRPYSCSHCSKSFLSQQNLTQHERTHSGVKEFACHLCGKQFGSAHNLEVHSIVHTGYKPFSCGLCGKAFARKAEIRDHERTHTGERPYQCEFCGARFSQRSNLQSHKRATHYDDKRYKCEACGKGFKRRRLLDYHIKAAHTGERPFKCEVCEATFVYPEHFKKHRRIHTGEKPFLCEICGKAFNSRDNRNAHRFVHSDKKPYECLVCGAGFMRKPLLYQHMQAQNHLNDTIVINQPRLMTDDDRIVALNKNGDMEIIDHVLVDSTNTVTENQEIGEEQADAVEHIIIDGEQIRFADDDLVENEETQFEHVITGDALVNGESQIINTPDGPVQVVKVKIPNENGEEEEAWIKIIPE